MRLLHRTDWWGDTITWRQVPADEVDIQVIWVQVLLTQKSPSCCPNFGARRVGVSLVDLTLCHDDRWSLYYVSGTAGDNAKSDGVSHFFQKLLLIPVGAKGYGKANCKALGWELVGHWNASSDSRSLPQLQSLLNGFEKEDGFERCHVHLGIHMEALAAGKSHNDKRSLKQIKKAIMAGKSHNDKTQLKQMKKAIIVGKRANDKKTGLKKKKQVVSARKGQKNKTTSSKRVVMTTRTEKPLNEWKFTV